MDGVGWVLSWPGEHGKKGERVLQAVGEALALCVWQERRN